MYKSALTGVARDAFGWTCVGKYSENSGARDEILAFMNGRLNDPELSCHHGSLVCINFS